MPKYHEPVLKGEVLQYLNAEEDGLIVDGTLGDGGHTEFILNNTGPRLRILGIDRDSSALARARERLKPFRGRIHFAQGKFSQIKEILQKAGFGKIDGLLLDLGVSSPQIDTSERGFSFMHDGPLDMRMDPDGPTTAADLLTTLSDHELETVIKNYGEERYSKRIVRAIRKAQGQQPILTTLQLSNILMVAVGSSRASKIHPATRTFQALRIAVNQELEDLQSVFKESIGILNAAARIVVISFHSLEDRIVKTFFRGEEKGCACPPRFPFCVCGRTSTLIVITRRPIRPTEEESVRNPRSSSAKLRVAERIYA